MVIFYLTNGECSRELSNSVSRIFYEEPFQIKKQDKIRQDELPGIFGEYGQRLIMIDVNDNAESTNNKSYCNIGEAKIAAEHLKLLLDLNQNAIAITLQRSGRPNPQYIASKLSQQSKDC